MGEKLIKWEKNSKGQVILQKRGAVVVASFTSP